MTADERFIYQAPDTDEEFGVRSEIITGPVSDWATDFSHLEPEWSADPYPIQDDLRQRCPIAHTGRFGGAWLPTRFEDVAAIAYDTERFSSRSIIMSNFRPPPELAPVGGVPPISSDPPFHHHARKLLLGAFTKTAISRQEPATRAFCHELIDKLEGRDVADAAAEYAQHIPMRVIADMLGFPPEDGPRFREFVESVLEGINLPPEDRIERMFAGDKAVASLLVAALWLTVFFVMLAVRQFIADKSIEVVCWIGAAFLLLFNTASIVAMIKHYGHDKAHIYAIDIRHLDAGH